jgi:hypothetical protein
MVDLKLTNVLQYDSTETAKVRISYAATRKALQIKATHSRQLLTAPF